MGSETESRSDRLVPTIGQLIHVSGYRHAYIAKKMGLSAGEFSVKVKENRFSPEELTKMLTIIDNEDVVDFLMLETMRARKDDETLSIDEFYHQLVSLSTPNGAGLRDA